MNARAVVAVALAVLVGGAISVAAAAPAQAEIVPIAVDLGVLAPGATAHAEQRIEVPQDAVVTSAEWTAAERPADATWSVTLCPDEGRCIDADDLTGARLQAGTYTVSVDVTMSDSAPQGAVVSRSGTVALVAADGELAVTGGAAPWLALVVGVAAAGIGVLLLVRRRRRERAS